MLVDISAGYIPLLDSAVLVVAADGGFAESEGVALHLSRETSWANIRDRIGIGHFDAAHMLAPMPIAASLGLGPLAVPMLAPVALGLGGNAVTVSSLIGEAMRREGFADTGPRNAGEALRHVIAARQRQSLPRLRLAVVHIHSSHNYDLRYWLAACGIDPVADVDITVVPPPYMADALLAGQVDGFCVGEPWNSVAVAQGGGRIVTTKAEIWRRSPEKILGVSQGFAERQPEALGALVRALIAAAQWCDAPQNHRQLATMLARPDRLGIAEDLLMPALSGHLQVAAGEFRDIEEFMVFSRFGANRPETAHEDWLFQQMLRWGDIPADHAAAAVAVFRPDLYDAALQSEALGPLVSHPPARRNTAAAVQPSGLFNSPA